MTDLLTLQNRLKRDPEGYREEFLQQVRHFFTNLQIFKLQPISRSGSAPQFNTSAASSTASKDPTLSLVTGHNAVQSRRIQEFCALIAFLSHCAPLYPEESKQLNVCQELFSLLSDNVDSLDPLLRKTLVNALILLQKKGFANRLELYSALFPLFKCYDQELRSICFNFIVTDLFKLSQTSPSVTITNDIQRVIFGYMAHDDPVIALKATHVLVELWKRNVWVNDKIVNQISNMIFTTHDKLISAALYFFLGDYDTAAQETETKHSEAVAKNKEIAILKYSMKHMKRKLKKQRLIDRTKKAAARAQRSMEDFDDEENQKDNKSANIAPLMHIHNPQRFAERMFYKLKMSKETFQTRMLLMEVLSKLIGLHKLLLFNFYPFVQRYLQPHQRHVTVLLSFVIRATHNLVPPEVLQPVVKTIANGFVTDKSGPEVITVGINSIREICSRAPLVMTQELLHDLVDYKSHKNKGIMSATRSLLNVFRELNPALLKKRDRGRDAVQNMTLMKTEQTMKDMHDSKLDYGSEYVHRDVIGADLLYEAGIIKSQKIKANRRAIAEARAAAKAKAAAERRAANANDFDEDEEIDIDGLSDDDEDAENDDDDNVIDADDDEEWDDATKIRLGELLEFKQAHLSKQRALLRNKKVPRPSAVADDDEDEDGEAPFDLSDLDLDALMAEGEELGVFEGEDAIEGMFGEGELDGFDFDEDGEGELDEMDFDFDEDGAEEEEEEIPAKSSQKRRKSSQTAASADEDELVQLDDAEEEEEEEEEIATPKAALRILTPADFKRMQLLKERQLQAKLKGNKLHQTVLMEDFEEQETRMQAFKEQSYVDIDSESLNTATTRKRRLEKEQRVKEMHEHKAALRAGTVGNNNQVTQRLITNNEKTRTKAFQMVKHSKKVTHKTTESFRHKQNKFASHIKTLRSMRRNLRKKVSARKR